MESWRGAPVLVLEYPDARELRPDCPAPLAAFLADALEFGSRLQATARG